VKGEELESVAIRSLSEDERGLAVVYISDRLLEPGDELEIDGGRVEVVAPTVMAFIDLEPGVNWGHTSRYLLIDRHSGNVRAVEAQFPPFLRGAPEGLRVVYRAPGVPDWAIATE
jgi:hypothetical protein